MKSILCALILFFMSSFSQAEWRFYAEEKGNVFFLDDSPADQKKCKGLKGASEQRLVLGEFKYIRDLCYEVSNTGKVNFVDPEKIFPFNRFSLQAEKFNRIPTKEERQREEDSRRQEALLRNLNRIIENTKSQDAPGSNGWPQTIMIDGNLKIESGRMEGIMKTCNPLIKRK